MKKPEISRNNDPKSCVSEFPGEGTGAPMLMLRRGRYRYICCMTDPDQLFDLQADLDEVNNLATDAATAIEQAVLAGFREEAEKHWDAEAVRQKVLQDQHRRRTLHGALRMGKVQNWDYNQPSDASQQFIRSHMDLTRHEIVSRYPRPPEFKPGD